MSHAAYEERLAVCPDLTPAERADVDAHLGACAGCAARLAEYRALQRALQTRPTPQPGGRLRAGFYAAVARAREEDRRPGRWARLMRATLALGNAAAWAAVGAVAVLLLAGLAITGPQLARRVWPAQPTMPAESPTPTATPAASATPGATPAPSATPAATPAALPISPVATGASIAVSGWSPDGQWLAFWKADDGAPANPYPQMTLHFYNADSDETCNCPEFQTQASNQRPLALEWQDDGQVVVWDGAQAMRGTPCQGGFTPTNEAPATGEDEALSPGSSYRAATREERTGDGRINVTTTFVDARSGQTVQTVDYTHRGGLGSLGLGGEWVTDCLFLIRETLDRGPLLVDVRQGHVIEVLSGLFGIAHRPTLDLGFWAQAAAVEGSDAYHILLGGVGLESAYPPLELYHSETGQVEALQFKYPWSPIFSPDGRWLLMDARPDRPATGRNLRYESYALWARPVDPSGAPAHLVADGDFQARWSPDWTRVAMAGPGAFFGLPNVTTVYSFPEGTALGSWATGEYQARPDAWSPDGRRLAMSGNVPGEWRYALFVVQP